MSPPTPHSCLRNIDGVLSHLKTCFCPARETAGARDASFFLTVSSHLIESASLDFLPFTSSPL